MGSEEDEHVVLCCFLSFIVSCLDFMLSFAFADHYLMPTFPFIFSPLSVVEIFGINTKTGAFLFFQSGHLSFTTIVSQTVAYRQSQLKLMGVIYNHDDHSSDYLSQHYLSWDNMVQVMSKLKAGKASGSFIKPEHILHG